MILNCTLRLYLVFPRFSSRLKEIFISECIEIEIGESGDEEELEGDNETLLSIESSSSFWERSTPDDDVVDTYAFIGLVTSIRSGFGGGLRRSLRPDELLEAITMRRSTTSTGSETKRNVKLAYIRTNTYIENNT